MIVPSIPRSLPSRPIMLEEGDQVRLFPHPGDRWNSSPQRWPSVGFTGHHEMEKLTLQGKPFMQLCYQINRAPLEPVDPEKIITGQGTLHLLPSDVAGGGNLSNNKGSIRVKVIGGRIADLPRQPERQPDRPEPQHEEDAKAIEEGYAHYVIGGSICSTLPPEDERDPSLGAIFKLTGPNSPERRLPGGKFSFPVEVAPVGNGRITDFDRTSSSITRLVDSTGKDLGRKEVGESFNLGQKTDKPRFGILSSGSWRPGRTAFIRSGKSPAQDAKFLSIEGIMMVKVSPEFEKRTSTPVKVKEGAKIQVGGETLEISSVELSEKGQSISIRIDQAGPGKEGLDLLDAAGEELDPPMEMSIGDSVTMIYSRIDPPLEELRFSYHPDVKEHAVPFKLKIPLE